ncbi:MAG: hypothetical protein JNK82_10760 [Myxococcaceae bacterium]|nr:hypothetical protein [Myxococcaceae bacterium]
MRLEPALTALAPAVRGRVVAVVERTAASVRKSRTPADRMRLRREAFDALTTELADQPLEAGAALREQLFGDALALADIELALAAAAARPTAEVSP